MGYAMHAISRLWSLNIWAQIVSCYYGSYNTILDKQYKYTNKQLTVIIVYYKLASEKLFENVFCETFKLREPL